MFTRKRKSHRNSKQSPNLLHHNEGHFQLSGVGGLDSIDSSRHHLVSQLRVNAGAAPFAKETSPPYQGSSFSRPFSTTQQGHLSRLRAPSTGSIRSGASALSRRVGAIDNNVMASTADRSRVRRERTFVGSECAVCDEPLEHTLQGERILQFSCTHVAHEACFYEFIRDVDGQYCPTCEAPLHLDTSRGGNVIDINKISNLVRSAGSDTRSFHTSGWGSQSARPPSVESLQAKHPSQQPSSNGRESSIKSNHRDSRESSLDRHNSLRHLRSDSDAKGSPSCGAYSESVQSSHWHHGYDVQAMETTPGSPRATSRNISPPTVTVRSEFPTISRSRQQQTLTCLVTVEVADNKWRSDAEESSYHQAPRALANIDEVSTRSATRAPSAISRLTPYEPPEVLELMTEHLRNRVENWYGLDFGRFGPLKLHGTLRVGKDKVSWQELECYLFAEMLICVKEKKPSATSSQWEEGSAAPKPTRCTLKGSILIRKHLNEVLETGSIDENVLTLSLSVAELPHFHLRFDNRNQLKLWNQALLEVNAPEPPSIRSPDYDRGEFSDNEEEAEWQRSIPKRASTTSSWGPKSVTTAPTEDTNVASRANLNSSLHVPIDVVVVVPISSSMQGVKINLVRDALRFMVNTLGNRDRMGLVTFGSGGGGVPIVGMTTKAWLGWANILSSIKPVGQKSYRADVVEGANVAMDLLMQRKHNNPIATIMLISDASTADADSVDFVVSRAEAAKITIHSFGLGMTHKPDTMIELSTKTKAPYTYVKDWMMLRECLAGCLGSMQSISHQNVKLKLKLPEGSPAKFHKISGALQMTKRASGRDAEASLGDLRFGDKRDILVQLVIVPDSASPDHLPQDPWDNIVSGLEALGGSMDNEGERTQSVEEVPLVQADLSWRDVLRDGPAQQMSRPSLLAITMLPPSADQKKSWQNSPPIPPHPSVVQRRMELLTSDMLTRALTLVSRGQHDRAHTLLSETRSILKGLGKGGLPPVPTPGNKSTAPSTPRPGNESPSNPAGTPERKRSPSPPASSSSGNGSANGYAAAAASQTQGHTSSTSRSTDGLGLGSGIDARTVAALDAELKSSLEWINHPAVFARDSRKAVLQAIGVISSQRAFTLRTPIECLWSGRVSGIKRLADRSREWREEGGGQGGIVEEG
ncbi:hypothetical protein E4U58_006197 [Claviceps cyperi]|nr:hypothetical protein E4U58_006197 [Claviceps cyperi]